MAMGTVLGFSSPAGLIFLRGEDSILLTESQNGWVSSIATLGAVFGGPLSGWSMKQLGRKVSILWSSVPYITGWLLISKKNWFFKLTLFFMTNLCLICFRLANFNVSCQ